MRLEADLCVIGSGAGGMSAATVAAEAGMRVVVLEAGQFLTPGEMTQREEEMFPSLFWDGANRTTRDRAIKIHQGRGVGGSTLHNLNLCKRIPRVLRDEWAQAQPLERLTSDVWDALYDEVEALLAVSEIPRAEWNRHNLLLERACAQLGWRGGPLRHNRSGCLGSGFCELGCAYDAKNNAAKVLLPRAVRAGAEIISRCQAIRVTQAQGAVSGVEAVTLGGEDGRPGSAVEVVAHRVCIAASATGTPALLLRSGLPVPEAGLRVHPGVVIAGDFDEPVFAWRGIPQSYECTELLDFTPGADKRVWIVPAFAHPVGAATLIGGEPALHAEIMGRYAHLGALTAMLHDRTAGRVRPRGELGLQIDYWPDAADRAQLALGLQACARLLFAAGARRVIVPASPPRVLERGAAVESLASLPFERGQIELTAVHPMASVPMSDDPRRGVVGSDGKHHALAGLWIADGSLFPTSIGVPPQLSIYALGLHVGRCLANAAARG